MLEQIGYKNILILIAILLAVITVFVINILIKCSTEERILSQNEAKSFNADAILVLGALVYDSGMPSHMLEDRILTSIELYNNGISQKILMSGDHGQEAYDEVNIMKNYAINRGVPSENVFMDHAGFSTYESIYRAKEIFQCNKILIVTQKYHLYRSLFLAQKLGLEAYGVSADLRTYVTIEKNKVREFFARIKAYLYAVVKPKPTYLGEAVPISGNGDATNDK